MKKSSSAHPVRSNSAKKKSVSTSPGGPSCWQCEHLFRSPGTSKSVEPFEKLSVMPASLMWLIVTWITATNRTFTVPILQVSSKKTYKLVGKYPIIHQLNFFELISHEQMIKNAWTWNLAPYSHVLARSYKVLPAQSPSPWLSSYIDSTWESLDATARPKKKTWGVVAK